MLILCDVNVTYERHGIEGVLNTHGAAFGGAALGPLDIVGTGSWVVLQGAVILQVCPTRNSELASCLLDDIGFNGTIGSRPWVVCLHGVIVRASEMGASSHGPGWGEPLAQGPRPNACSYHVAIGRRGIFSVHWTSSALTHADGP